MVKNRKTKTAARNLKQESGITYPRALDLVQGGVRPAGFRVAGGTWEPERHRNLWIEAGPVGRELFDMLVSRARADESWDTSVYDFEDREALGYILTAAGPASDAAALFADLQDVRREKPGRRRLIMLAGVPRLRTTHAGDQVLSRIAEMAPEGDCTFIVMGGLEPARGYWSRHYTSYEAGIVSENLAVPVPGTWRSDLSSRPLRNRVLLGIGKADYQDVTVEADFRHRASILVTGDHAARTAAAQSIAESTGGALWPGTPAALLSRVKDDASRVGENAKLPDPATGIAAVFDLDALGGQDRAAVLELQGGRAWATGLQLVLTSKSAAGHPAGSVATIISIDGGEAEVIDSSGLRVVLKKFWHSRPLRATQEAMEVNAAANTLDSGANRVWPQRKPVIPLDLQPGDLLRFHLGRTVYTVRGTSENFVVATGSERRKPIYTVIDWAAGQRGPHDSWGYGAVTDEEVTELLAGLELTRARDENSIAPEESANLNPVKLSIRRAVHLDISSVHRGRALIWPTRS